MKINQLKDKVTGDGATYSCKKFIHFIKFIRLKYQNEKKNLNCNHYFS